MPTGATRYAFPAASTKVWEPCAWTPIRIRPKVRPCRQPTSGWNSGHGADQRLEFWAWDFIADRDTTLDIRYHRMEVYGLRVFRIPGAMPCYQIFVRPMSLTRFQQMEASQTQHAQDVSNIEQGAARDDARAVRLAPTLNRLKATVWIDGEEVPILMKQEIKEYFSADEWGNAYLLTVDRPKQDTDLPYHVFKVELEDLDNGDRGEGLYYMEKEKYVN